METRQDTSLFMLIGVFPPSPITYCLQAVGDNTRSLRLGKPVIVLLQGVVIDVICFLHFYDSYLYYIVIFSSLTITLSSKHIVVKLTIDSVISSQEQ